MALTKQRYDLVDALRGFAVIGILLLHSIEHFNFYSYPDNATQSAWMINTNGHIWDTMFWLFGSKAYGIFALLFGFTFHLQFSKQAEKGKDFGPRFMWRMLLLLTFGLINSILFPGVILVLYAVLSPTLLMIRKWSNKAVLIWSIFFLLQPYELYHGIRSIINPEYIPPFMPVGKIWGETMAYIHEGTFAAMIINVFTGIKMMFVWSMSVGRVIQTIGLFGLGVYFGRTVRFDNSVKSGRFWRNVMLIALPLTLILGWILNHAFESTPDNINRSLKVAIKAWRNGGQLLITVALFAWAFRTRFFQKITKPLYAYGRMSLSNYVLQSLVGGILFYPYAFYLAKVLNVTYSLLLGFALAILYVFFCNWWIKKYRQGPLEKIWHKLTWL